MKTLLLVSLISVDTTVHAGHTMSKTATKHCADVCLDLYVYWYSSPVTGPVWPRGFQEV